MSKVARVGGRLIVSDSKICINCCDAEPQPPECDDDCASCPDALSVEVTWQLCCGFPDCNEECGGCLTWDEDLDVVIIVDRVFIDDEPTCVWTNDPDVNPGSTAPPEFSVPFFDQTVDGCLKNVTIRAIATVNRLCVQKMDSVTYNWVWSVQYQRWDPDTFSWENFRSLQGFPLPTGTPGTAPCSPPPQEWVPLPALCDAPECCGEEWCDEVDCSSAINLPSCVTSSFANVLIS